MHHLVVDLRVFIYFHSSAAIAALDALYEKLNENFLTRFYVCFVFSKDQTVFFDGLMCIGRDHLLSSFVNSWIFHKIQLKILEICWKTVNFILWVCENNAVNASMAELSSEPQPMAKLKARYNETTCIFLISTHFVSQSKYKMALVLSTCEILIRKICMWI